MTAFSLQARPPFSFASLVNSHGWAQLAPFNASDDGSRLAYILRFASGRVAELRLSEQSGGVQIECGLDLTPAEQAEATRAVSWMAALDQDFSAFYRAARAEPKLSRVEARAQGRVLRSPTVFEDVVKTILTTNTLWAATRRMCLNLVTQFGEPLPDDPQRKAFPTPQALAESSPPVLKEQTRLGYRAGYIHELALRVSTGELDLERYKDSDLDTPQLRKELMQIKGVGGYAAANLLMILGRFDFIPIDSWAFKMVSHEWHNGEPVGPGEVESAFEKWGEFRGLAYWFWDWSYKGG